MVQLSFKHQINIKTNGWPVVYFEDFSRTRTLSYLSDESIPNLYISYVCECRMYMTFSMTVTNGHFDYLQESGNFDPSYFALDCFHPNRKLHQIMASGLWNNMVRDRCARYDNPDASCLFAILL